MKNAHFLLLIVFISVSCVASAAEKKDTVKVRDFLEFGLSVGYGDYKMEYLKEIDELIKKNCVNPDPISEFGYEPYFMFEGLFNFTKNVRGGFILGYRSTRSEFNYDKNNIKSGGKGFIDASSIVLAAQLEYKALDLDVFQIWLHGELGANGNIVDIDTDPTGGVSGLNGYYFHFFETNFVAAQLKFATVVNDFEFSFRGGYTYDITTKSITYSNYGTFVEESATDWTGVNLVLTATYKFR